MNEIILGDNLEVMKSLPSGSVDLIATDPPFNTGKSRGTYSDSWSDWYEDVYFTGAVIPTLIEAARLTHGKGMAGFLCFLSVRLVEMHRVLKPTGSIYLHCDHSAGHYIKLCMDAIFDVKNFQNEIVWCYKSGGASPSKYFSRKHDIILWYSKGKSYCFNPQQEKSYNRDFKPYRFAGVAEYQDEVGWYTMVGMKDYWQIDMVGRSSRERCNYPTQKPLALYERIIKTSSNEGDLVLDPFCGSGTSLVAAKKLGRNYIGMDVNQDAVSITRGRINSSDIPSSADYNSTGSDA